MNLIDTIRTDIEGVLDKHAAAIESGIEDAAAVAASPLAAAAAAAVHLPASTGEAFAMFLERLDADFAKFAAPGPTASTAVTGAATPDIASTLPAETGPAPKIGDVPDPA